MKLSDRVMGWWPSTMNRDTGSTLQRLDLPQKGVGTGHVLPGGRFPAGGLVKKQPFCDITNGLRDIKNWLHDIKKWFRDITKRFRDVRKLFLDIRK